MADIIVRPKSMKPIAALLLLVLPLLGACREYSYYRFKPVSLDIWRGELRIGVEGSYRDFTENGKRYQEWADPYALVFRYYFPNTEKIDRIEVTSLLLIGNNSGTRLELAGRDSTQRTDIAKWFDKNDQRISMGLSVRAPEEKNLIYEPYTLRCTFRLYSEGSLIEEKQVDVILDTDFKKGKRSDTFDALMSV